MYLRKIVASLVATLAMLTATVINAPSAHAMSHTEQFIHAVHQDFLLRDARADEVTWWTAYLSGGSRQSMVASILDSQEFKGIWVYGASIYYSDAVDPQMTTILDDLVSSGDFVGSEIDLLAGSTYYAANGSTNTGFVQALYEDVLFRAPDSGGLAYWVGRLDAATATRAGVANHFIRTTEAATRRVAGVASQTSCTSTELIDLTSLAAGSYCLVLDRMADPGGTSYWTGQLSGSSQLPTLWAAHAGSSEYWNLVPSRF